MDPIHYPKLPPTIDIVFGMLFDQRDGCRLLISFLNGVLKFSGQDRITELTILPRHVSSSGADDKQVILDIRARCASGRQFNVEVQVRFYEDYPERLLYYWAGMYHGQLDSGDLYGRLQPAYSLNLLGFPLLRDTQGESKDYHHEYELMCRKTGHCLTQHIRVHIVELIKFHTGLNELADEEQKWLFFLRFGHEMTQAEVQQLGIPEIAEAERRLDMISQDRILRIQAEQLDKARRDALAWEARMEYGEQVRKEGHKEGLREGRIQLIADLCEMCDIDLTPERRTQLGQLDLDQMEALRLHLKTHRLWPIAPLPGTNQS